MSSHVDKQGAYCNKLNINSLVGIIVYFGFCSDMSLIVIAKCDIYSHADEWSPMLMMLMVSAVSKGTAETVAVFG